MELSDIHDIVGMFQTGQVGVFPTDTAFGIGCVINNSASVGRIFEIRHRAETKPLLALVSSIEMAREYVTIDPEVRAKLIEKHWPGGLTLILYCNKEKVPSAVRSNGETLAVRLPNHEKLVKIIEKIGSPIVAPSANFAGEKTPYHLSEVDPLLIQKVDFVMTGECTVKEQSTIIDCSKMPWEIVRPGAINIELPKVYPQTHLQGVSLYIDTSDAERIRVRIEKDGEEFSREAARDRKSQVTLELIEQLLQEASLKLDQIENLYVKEGPGSYTGLKVGATIANTLSFVLQVPVNDLPVGKYVNPSY